MRKQSKDSESPVQEFEFDPQSSTVTALWSLRILIRLGGHKKMYCRFGNGIDEDILEAVGLGHLEDRKIDKNACHKNLKQRLHELERHPPPLPNTLSANLELVREALRLTDAGVALVAFVSLIHADHRLGEALKALQHSGYSDAIARVISTVINFPVDEVRACLGPRSILRTSGMLKLRIGGGYRCDMTDYLCLIEEMQSALFTEHDSADSLFGWFFRISPEPKLTKEDYAHLKRDYQLALAHLRANTRQKSSGVNILIHGPPGVGKTEFARAVAKDAGLALYEINTESGEGNPAGNQRIRWYQFCQRSLTEKKALCRPL